MLNDELNHRVKNVIALVKSIVLQTGSHVVTVEEYAKVLEGRLRALALAHDLALNGGGDLSRLIEAEADVHRHGAAPERVMCRGPRIWLADRAFEVLALVIHELMTNAAKYGGLSTPEGRLSVDWELSGDGDCVIVWREQGGPPVAPPERLGFGSKLIQSTVRHDLGGVAQVDYAPGGVIARLVVPAHNLRPAPPETPASDGEEKRKAPISLAGLSILLVEDQALIAMDVELTLQELGATRVRLSSGVSEARDAIAEETPDCAILDFNLGRETAEPIAEELARLGAPFVFATGYGDTVMIPERFRKAPVVRKPIDPARLLEQISLVVTGRKSSENEDSR